MNVKPTYRKSWAGNLLMWSGLTLSPSFNIRRGRPNLKVLITCLLLIIEVFNVKPTYTKSWARNLLMLDLTLKYYAREKVWCKKKKKKKIGIKVDKNGNFRGIKLCGKDKL